MPSFSPHPPEAYPASGTTRAAAGGGKRLAGRYINTDVLIVGGGLVGLFLARALSSARIASVIVERRAPTDGNEVEMDGRASAIAPGCVRALELLGVWRDPVMQAQAIHGMRISAGGPMTLLSFDEAQVEDQPLAFMVENKLIVTALKNALKNCSGVQLLMPATVGSIDWNEEFVVARLEGGVKIKAGLIVAADGRASPIRQMRRIPTVEHEYDQVGIVCTLEHQKPHHGLAAERFLESGPFAILPLAGGRSSIVWTEKTAQARHIFGGSNQAFMAELRRRVDGFLGDFRIVGPVWSYPISLVYARTLVDHRLALVGDAGHTIHPLAGQGLNLGLRDAATLAELLAERRRAGGDLVAAGTLSRYDKLRRFDIVSFAVLTDLLNGMFSGAPAPFRWIGQAGLLATNYLPPVKRLMMRHAMADGGNLPRLLAGQPL